MALRESSKKEHLAQEGTKTGLIQEKEPNHDFENKVLLNSNLKVLTDKEKRP